MYESFYFPKDQHEVKKLSRFQFDTTCIQCFKKILKILNVNRVCFN